MPAKPSTPTPARLYYGSVCSGIEAVSLAWQPLGFRPAWFAEIDPFPCAVLSQHYPDVPNLGDMTKIADLVRAGTAPAPDLLVGGTPCQSFSIAGDRRGLDDPRGALTLCYVELANAIDQIRLKKRRAPATLVWENVPGVLSDKTNAFGCLLGALAGEDGELEPPGTRWSDAGCVYGPQRAIAWRVLDAQYFGLAQRRRRVFLVASARTRFDPAAVLFECEGVRRDSAPSRKSGEDITGTLSARAQGGGGLGTDFECSGGLIASTGDISRCLNASGMGRQDLETDTLIAQRGVTLHGTHPSVQTVASYDDLAQCLRARTPGNIDNSSTTVVQCITSDVTHTLKADGFDGSEDGTGRGTPIIAFSCKNHGADATDDLTPTLRAMNHRASHANAGGQMAIAYAIQAGALRENPRSGPDGIGVRDAIAYTIEARAEVQAVAYGIRTANTSSNGWGVQEELTHALDRAMGVAVAFAQNSRSEVRLVNGDGAIAGAIAASCGVQQQNYVAWQEHCGCDSHGDDRPLQGPVDPIGTPDTPQGIAKFPYAVRRLLPIECERLQGMPDHYTLVPYRGKPAADGPRYKAIGNSMAVPCVAWLGERLRQALL